jgi:hypothetical protein
VLPENTSIDFLTSVRVLGASVMLYPTSIVGNLHKIRKWIESKGTPPFIISDDDPGSSFKGGIYQGKKARVMFPNIENKCGAERRNMSAEDLCFLWRMAFLVGKKERCAYVGLNGSEQQLSALPGHETVGRTPKRSLGTYGYVPFNYNAVITGACGVLKPCRNYVNPKVQHVPQEYTAASVEAITNHGGTLMLMPVIFGFAVKPLKNAESDNKEMRMLYPFVVEQGNTAGGRDSNKKTGCIVHLKTRQSYVNPRQSWPKETNYEKEYRTESRPYYSYKRTLEEHA